MEKVLTLSLVLVVAVLVILYIKQRKKIGRLEAAFLYHQTLKEILFTATWERSLKLAEENDAVIQQEGFEQIVTFQLYEKVEKYFLGMIESGDKNAQQLIMFLHKAVDLYYWYYGKILKGVVGDVLEKNPSARATFTSKIISQHWMDSNGKKLLIISDFFLKKINNFFFLGDIFTGPTLWSLLVELFESLHFDSKDYQSEWENFTPDEKIAAKKIIAFFDSPEKIAKYQRGQKNGVIRRTVHILDRMSKGLPVDAIEAHLI